MHNLLNNSIIDFYVKVCISDIYKIVSFQKNVYIYYMSEIQCLSLNFTVVS